MKRITATTLFLAAIAATQLGATDCGHIIHDDGFDLWCGDRLCAWKLERGDIRSVPTWHEGDDGVELLGEDTAIWQLTGVTNNDSPCIEFELLADVAAGTDVVFQADVWGDGTFEYEQPVPGVRWEPVKYIFVVDGLYQGIRFRIAKRGAGHAVIAQLDARTCEIDPSGAMHVAAGPGPLGAMCYPDGDAACASAMCERFPGDFSPPMACGTCEIGAACPNGGDVCGLAPAPAHTLLPYATCLPAASKAIGEQCGVNDECADGWCMFGVCSACFDQSCGAGVACDVANRVEIEGTLGQLYPAPFVCAPGAQAGAAGTPCSSANDCASGQCTGAPRNVCPDGRACVTDEDCPQTSGLDHEACKLVGLVGGTCQ
jgi:hypothetical protein